MKTVVEVQQHFNDIGMRIRSLFITVLLALFASIGFMLDKKLSIPLSGLHVQFSTLIPLFGVFGTWLFYIIDRYWYHRLLVGAVKQGALIEEMYKAELPELTLGKAISEESPYKPGVIEAALAALLVSDKRYRESGLLHSDGKIELFYKSVAVALLLATVALALAGGVSFDTPARAAKGQARPAAGVSTPAPPKPPGPPQSGNAAAPQEHGGGGKAAPDGSNTIR